MNRKLQIAVPILGVLIFISRRVIGLALQLEGERKIFINEICSNNACIEETDKHYNDYIELYNASDQEISLNGWFLSDDEEDLKKCELADISISPKSYLLILADGEGEDIDEVAFKINSKGENIFLTDQNGNMVDNVKVPALEANTVWARTKDGGLEWKRMTPTPRTTNDRATPVRNEILNDPVFSQKSGFYENEFRLELSAEPGEIIYYTLDGSVPTEASNVYVGEIVIDDVSDNPNVYNSIKNVVVDWKEYVPSEEPVDKAVVVRAIAADGQGNTSDVVTATYFVNQNRYQNVNILSIVADPEDLFGDEGIHVTGMEYDEWYLSGAEGEAPEPSYMKGGRKYEIEGNIQLFEAGQEILNQNAGLRIQGEGSRSQPKKRFSIYARKEYNGSPFFDCSLFPNRQTHSVVLNDGFANAFSYYLVNDRDIAVLQSTPVTVFLNGEYWYTTYIQEKYNKFFFSDEFGVDPDDVIIIKAGNLEEGDKKGLHFYEQLLEFIGQVDMTDAGVYKTLNELIDVQSYIDFMCSNIYLCNMDVSETHNYMLWRTRESTGSEYGDERWRWILYDMDYLEDSNLDFYRVSGRAQINSFSAPMKYTDTTYREQFIFSRLFLNENFRKQFVLSFMDMANTNFSPERVEKKLKEWGKDLTWNDSFFAERFDYIVPYMAEEFSLQGTLETLNLETADPNAGTIQVNTCKPDLSEGLWSGKYYTDYPITLTATANEGYCFIGWEGDYESAEETISVQLKEGNTNIKAIFEKIEE